MCLSPGYIVGERYTIVSILKKGGFGRTYQARDISKTDNTLCVVKEIIPPQTNNLRLLQDAKKRFQREVQSLYRLGNHPQIPKLFAYFQENGKFYLVQEYIEGQDLKQELASIKKLNDEEVIKLLWEILEVLDFVHQQGVIHRDIKPSNLIRRKQDQKIILIDFGAVKEITNLSEKDSEDISETRVIGTENYMSPETRAGKPKPSSDIYAVGIIGIQALTGIHPRNFPTDPRTGELIWRFSTPDTPILQVSKVLEKVLNKMVCYHFKERYQSASEVLLALSEISKSPLYSYSAPEQSSSSFIKNKFSFILRKSFNQKVWFGWGLATSILVFSIFLLSFFIPKTCTSEIEDALSCGEELLIENQPSAEEQAAIDAFSGGNYQESISWFEKARQKNSDNPETLIYLNNAKLIGQNVNIYTVAAVVSLGEILDGGDTGREVLRGVAQFQDEFNQNFREKGFGIKILIANDQNNPEQAAEIAQKLADKPGVIAVIGHDTSSSTLAAIPIYEQNNLVSITPTSTAEQLSEGNPFLFRTVPKNKVNAEALANYLLGQAQQEKVAIFYNPENEYSRSLHDQFLISFYEGGGQVVKQFDLSKSIFDANEAIAQAEAREVNALVLFPDPKDDPYTFLHTIKVIGANQNRYLMVGGDSLYNSDILQERELTENMVVAIPWSRLNSFNTEFITAAKNLWGAEVSWRTATAYDALRAISVAIETQIPLNYVEWLQSRLDSSIERLRIQQSLKNPDFKAFGATGEISFEVTGDRKESVVDLVKIVPDKCSPYGYTFIPIKYPDPEAAGLKCDR